MKKTMLVEERIIAVLLCIMVLMVAAQVLSRYIFHTSLSHTEELVRYFFVWVTFLGIAAAVARKKHLSVAVASSFLPEKFVKWTHIVSGVCAVLFTAVVLVTGIRVVLLQVRTHQTTAALGMPMWIMGLAIPVCAIVLITRIIISGYNVWNGR